jgi:hypothetical protein
MRASEYFAQQRVAAPDYKKGKQRISGRVAEGALLQTKILYSL